MIGFFWAFWATEVVGSWVGASRVGPAFAEILREEEELSRCARGVGCSDSTALCGPSRCRWLVFGPMGRGLRWWWVCLVFWALWATEVVGSWVGASRVGPRLHRFFGRRKSFRAAREGWGAQTPLLSAARSRCRSVMSGVMLLTFGDRLLWEDWRLGTGWTLDGLRIGDRLVWVGGRAPRDRSCARREARGRYGFFALCAKWRG
jgi:membrane-associated protease RseP (regulator of RpoE activity)